MRTTVMLLVALVLAASASAASPPVPVGDRPDPGSDALGAGLRPHGRWVRPRGGPQPVRRPGPGEGEPQLPRHPLVLLPGHDDLRRRRSPRCRILIADGRPAVKIASTVPFSVDDAAGVVTPLPAGKIALKPGLKLPVDGKPTALPGPLEFQPGKAGDPDAGRQGLPRRAPGHGRRQEAAGHRRRRARRLPPRRRPGRDAEGVARRRAAGAGRRGALVRAREPRQEP